jgi:hypothetical protein
MKKLPATCLDGRYTIKFGLQDWGWFFLKKGVTQGKAQPSPATATQSQRVF